MMAILPENLDYTDKDFDAIVARLNNLLAGVYPDWTDHTAASFGNILKELFAFVFDYLGFYQDNQAKESRLTDLELRENAIKIARMLGFATPGASAASADILVTLDKVPLADVVFSDGQEVRTRDVDAPARFQFIGELTIPAGTDPPQAFVTVENSANYEEDFQSTGLTDQEFRLSGAPYLDDSLVVLAGNGAYTLVDSHLDSGALDRHVVVSVDASHRANLRFGDGVTGAIPVGLISAQYKTGGGRAGNVEANTITRIDGSFTDELGNPVQVSVNNPTRASGGTDRMSTEQIKLRAPRSVRVSDRTVALDDYEIGAEAVQGVARALMLTADQAPGIPENRGFLYVIPVGGGLPTSVLKDLVLEAVTVTKPNTVTFRVEVVDPLYATFDFDITLFRKPGFTPSQVGNNVRAKMAEFFQLENLDGTPNEKIGFGFAGKQADGTPAREIPLMGELLAEVVAASTGVRKIGDRPQDFTINGSHADAPLELYEFPVLGVITLRDGDTGEVL